LGDVANRQVSGNLQLASVLALPAASSKGETREGGHMEEALAAQIVVARVDLGVHACRVDVDLDPIERRTSVVGNHEGAGDRVEAAVYPPDDRVPDAEHGKRVDRVEAIEAGR
jgi:hypothetical protein